MRRLKSLYDLLVNDDFEQEDVRVDLSSNELVEQAKRDWLAARNFFNEATEPDLVDYAIHELEAAERRYMHLLKKYSGKDV